MRGECSIIVRDEPCGKPSAYSEPRNPCRRRSNSRTHRSPKTKEAAPRALFLS